VVVTGLALVVVARRRTRAILAHPAIPSVRPRDVVLAVVSLSLGAGAITLGTKPLGAPAGTPGYSALWIQQTDDARVRAVARSAELQSDRYRIRFTVHGHEVARSRWFSLTPGESHGFAAPQRFRPNTRVRAQLYQREAGIPVITRRVDLLVR
jgi:hypothetical protein